MIMEGNNIYVPHEIIHNILKRFPVRSLIRFQCVCKNWKNTINDPFFIADHLQQSSNQPSLIPQRSYDIKESLHSLSLDSDSLQRHEFDKTPLSHYCYFKSAYYVREVEIIGSVNGLLCVKICRQDLFFPILLVWNPAIKEIKEVPTSNDGLMGVWRIGFGFSAISNDYKIVRIHTVQRYRHDENGYVRYENTKIVNGAQVYSLNTGLWKDLEFGAIESVDVFLRRTSISYNGAIIWVGEKRNYMREEVIISFDIETEVFTLIQVPPIRRRSSFSIPTIYDNKLALVQYHPMYYCSFRLWVIENNTCPSGGRWSCIKKYGGETNAHPYLLVPLTIWRNGIACRVLLKASNELDDYKRTLLCLLNPNTNEVKMFVLNASLDCYDDDVFIHVESLVSPCRRTLI